MAAYAALAFLSFLWGSSFLLIKIASRAFDPFGFRARARRRRGGCDAAYERPFGQGLAWIAAGIVVQPPRARADRAGRSLRPARKSGDADDQRRHGADDGRPADLRLSVRPLSRIARPLDMARRPWPSWSASPGSASTFWSPGAAGGAHSVLGRAFALAAGVSYGTGAIISGAATREIGAVRAVTASMTISTLVLALTGLAFGNPPPLAALFQIPLASLLAMGALGVFNTALAYYVYFRLVHDEGPTFASLNNYIVPLIGVIGGAVALAEPIAPSAWAGLALVLCGVALTGRSLRPAKASQARLARRLGASAKLRRQRRPLQRVGEPHRRRSGFERLRLALVRRPGGEPHEVESRAQAPVRIGEALGIEGGGARQDLAAQGLAAARVERVRAPHRAQVGDQREHVGVADDRAVEIDDRQRQPARCASRQARARRRTARPAATRRRGPRSRRWSGSGEARSASRPRSAPR